MVIVEAMQCGVPVVSFDAVTCKLSWSSVADATGYTVKITGTSSTTFTTAATSYTLTNKITTKGVYYVSVRAYKSGVASDYSNEITWNYEKKLATPTISLAGDMLSWNSITNATSYRVYRDTTLWFTVSSTSANLAGYSLSGGSYSITVTAYASNWTESDKSNSVFYRRLDAPVLTLTEDGLLSWPLISGADYYKVTIDGEVKYQGSAHLVDLTSYISLEDRHLIGVTAYSNSGYYSSTSTIKSGTGGGTGFDDAIPINLSLSGASLLNEEIDDTDYPIKYYKLVVLESGSYYLFTESSYDTYGILYDANQTELTYNDDGGTNLNFCINYSLEAGNTYYLAVRQYSRQTMIYDLYLNTIGPVSGPVTPIPPRPTPDDPIPEPIEPSPYPDQTTT